MVKKRYTIRMEDESKIAKGMLVNAPISTKFAREVAVAIKGMRLEAAEAYLRRVLAHEDWVPVRRYKKKVAHRKGVRGGVKSGRYMDKTVKYFLKLIQNVKANAEAKGLDVSALRIIHVWVGKGWRRPRIHPRTRRVVRAKSTHVEMVVSP